MKSACSLLVCSRCALLCAVAAFFATPVSAQKYTFTDLGTLPGGNGWTVSTGINNHGQVVGESNVGNVTSSSYTDWHAFLYTPAADGNPALLVDLGVLPGSNYSFAQAINDQGQIVGYSSVGSIGNIDTVSPNAHLRACLWEGGRMRDLGALPGTPNRSLAYDINASGQVVGTARDANNVAHAMLFRVHRPPLDKGAPAGSHTVFGGLNDAGIAAGYSVGSNGFARALRFNLANDQVELLPDLPNGGFDSSAAAINASGVVVGAGARSDGTYHALAWIGSTVTDLTAGNSLPPGHILSGANAINSAGVIVGYSTTDPNANYYLDPNQRAFIYRNGVLSDLNALASPPAGYILRTATGINDKGQITGFATTPDGKRRAYLLTPGATFNGIGFLPGDDVSEVRATSADGSKAVGLSAKVFQTNFIEGRRSVVWTAANGLQALPEPPADGTTDDRPTRLVTASDITASGNRIAYRARPGGTGIRVAMLCAGDRSQPISLGRLNPNEFSGANQISDDGAVVFGLANNEGTKPFRWTAATGLQQLAFPSGYALANPFGRGVSSDGSVSIGQLYSDTDNTEVAYRWTAATGIQPLAFLPGKNVSTPGAITADGTQIFGSTSVDYTSETEELFSWDAPTGMTSLGRPPVAASTHVAATGVSADGALLSVATGVDDPAAQDSFVTKVGSGAFFPLRDLLAAAGAPPSVAGWSKLAALGISDDGNVLYGFGADPNGRSQGWVARFPADYLRQVQVFTANSSSQSASVNGTSAFAGAGNYAASSLIISDAAGEAALTLASGANLSASSISVHPEGTLNLLPGAAASAQTIWVVENGAVRLDGDLTVISSGGALIDGVLGGGGTIHGAVSLGSTGQLTPGNSPGIFTVIGKLNATAGSKLSFEVNGPTPGVNADQVVVSGLINLGGATLDLTLGYTPNPGDQMVLISNQSGQAITGTFAGIPQHAAFYVGSTRVRANYAGGPSGNDFVLTVLAPPTAVSRKVHGNAGIVDLPLTTSGPPSIECRRAGANNDYRIVFSFPGPVSFSGAAVENGTGSVAATSGSGTSHVTVDVNGLTSGETIAVTLLNVNDDGVPFDFAVPMSVLVGDTNGDRSVNSGDSTQTRTRAGQSISATNFRSDVNADGSIDSGDSTIVRSRSGSSLNPTSGVSDLAVRVEPVSVQQRQPLQRQQQTAVPLLHVCA